MCRETEKDQYRLGCGLAVRVTVRVRVLSPSISSSGILSFGVLSGYLEKHVSKLNLSVRRWHHYVMPSRIGESRTKCHKSNTVKMPQDKMPQNENRTKCHRIRMHQNCNNKSYNSVTKA